MIISPPFLPPIDGRSDDEWLELAMVAATHGGYPVTVDLAWHGGIHIQAPTDNSARAMADGKVVYVRRATPKNDNQSDPLNYHAGAQISGWTSDGCVVIEHTTEIGEGIAARTTFFTIYMHLEEIPATLAKNNVIYRKDILGKAGFIYGKPNLIHLEVICDDRNLSNLIGRESGECVTTSDGRKDVVFGSLYYFIPTGSTLYAVKPPREALNN